MGVVTVVVVVVDLTLDRTRKLVEMEELEEVRVVLEESTLACSKVTVSRSESVKCETIVERRFAAVDMGGVGLIF
jgi:hypothetical protein